MPSENIFMLKFFLKNKGIMPNFDLIAKLKTSGWHFLLSLLIFTALAAWIYFYLFPSFYFTISGGIQGLMLMLAIDLILGPLLTFLVFNPKKSLREKITDFSVIGAVQATALVYGMFTVYQAHPQMLLMYPNSYAAVVPYEEWAGNDALRAINTENMVKLDGVPVAVQNHFSERQANFVSLAQAGEQIIEADALSRQNIKGEYRLILGRLEELHGKIYVFTVVGKYRRTFVAVDRNFHTVAKFDG